MAGRKKGTDKTGGRKKGTPNRTTKEARELLEQILYGQLENIEKSLNDLFAKDPNKHLDSCSKLFNYVLPKKTDITSDGDKIPPLPNITINANG